MRESAEYDRAFNGLIEGDVRSDERMSRTLAGAGAPKRADVGFLAETMH